MIAVIEIRVKQIDYHSVRDKGWFLSNCGVFGRKGEKMRFKTILERLLILSLCVCLTSEGLWLKNALASNTGRVVFTSFRDGNFEIYVMDAEGGNQENLTDHPAY